jgi:RNA polymerase sigma factor (sigma-70 family)
MWGAEKANMDQEEAVLATRSLDPADAAADALLLEQLRSGNVDAGNRFVRDYYPGIYRHLLYLTERPEVAEDLAQETFLQAWRHLDRFVPRAPLRAWLHRIAHREFLQSLRRQRPQTCLEELAELPAARAADLTEEVEMRMIIGKPAKAAGGSRHRRSRRGGRRPRRARGRAGRRQRSGHHR